MDRLKIRPRTEGFQRMVDGWIGAAIHVTDSGDERA
jgi:hypothetical protein